MTFPPIVSHRKDVAILLFGYVQVFLEKSTNGEHAEHELKAHGTAALSRDTVYI